jgi:hypothetical protein
VPDSWEALTAAVVAAVLAVALGASAVAATGTQGASYGPARAAYAGATAQQHPMSLTLTRSGRRVDRLLIRVDARCPASNQIKWEAIEFDASKIHRNGRFTDGGLVEGNTHVGDTVLNFSAKVKGKVVGRRAKGTVRLAGTVKDSAGKVIDKCDSGQVKWVLRRGSVYAGATSDGTAVAIKTTPSRRTVKSFFVDFLVTCGTAGDIHSRKHLNLQVGGDGRFAKQGAVSFDTPQGPSVSGQFSLKGRLKPSKASGTYRVSGTTQLANGSSLKCDTGTTKWSATRG